MPVRLRITFVFALLVFVILGLLCTGVYYFSVTAQKNTIKTRLMNRAISTARLLSQREIFNRELVQRIDSSTTIALKNKVVVAFDETNRKVYNYSDVPGDTVLITADLLREIKERGSTFFTSGGKEVVGYNYTHEGSNMVMIAAGEDEEGKKNLATLLRVLTISFIISVGLVLVIGYFFSRGLLLPVKKISEDVAEISAQNLARRIQTGNSRDEWYHLSNTFNELLNRLQESFELQRRFISNASHELSTPLTSISSQLQVALQREREAEDYKKTMRSVYQDVQHMSKLTQTLLEFAKASGDPGGLDISLVRIDEVVLTLAADVFKINPDFSLNINFDKVPEEEEKLVVFGNEPLLLTAIKNIVLNACKYSRDNQAELSLLVEDPYVIVKITDHGPGIPGSELEKIFQPFYRIEDNRLQGGFGLGLSLAEKIIKLHKGSIEVQSGTGEGTLFKIKIPGARFLEAV
jgi:two-component system, OmpR family, sensor histidine kinase ArlS